ncbi:MAG: hypothetical protein Kow0076_8610 [Francisella sp.]
MVHLCYNISVNIYIEGEKMILETNNHSIFKLNYHLVLVTKYRRKVVNDTISMRLIQIFERIGEIYLKRMESRSRPYTRFVFCST